MTQKPLTIALDAMGGDYAPTIVVEGAELMRKRCPSVSFIFFGDEMRIRPLINKHSGLAKISKVVHTDSFIANDEKPAIALRNGRQSSMRLAINAVANGEADCIVSAGNTGALMAMAKFVLKSLPGISRPAIASIFPTSRGRCVMLDLGANVDCDSDNLVQFSILGLVFAKTVLNLVRPSVGILNIGEEDVKGNDSVRQAAAELRRISLPGYFHGFVEGNDIGRGTVDVIVTDGFTGNVALKTMEGTAFLLRHFMKEAFTSSILAKLGAICSYFAIKDLRKKMDPRLYNGGMFLGLNGICVKSHGGTDAFGFSNAIWFAHQMASNNYNQIVGKELDKVHVTLENLESFDVLDIYKK